MRCETLPHAIRSSYQGVVRFFKEGSPDPIGMIAGVEGFVSCAVQLSVIDDEVELLPF